MGQYWKPVNLDKKEFLDPHKLGSGLKLWEQLAGGMVGPALIVLTAAMPERRGGGDLDMDENWHGPERSMDKYPMSPAPMPENYEDVARRTIGRWAGDRIALVGDYAEDSDLASEHEAASIYGRCVEAESLEEYPYDPTTRFKDVTDDVCRVLEHELNGVFTGTGWREFSRR